MTLITYLTTHPNNLPFLSTYVPTHPLPHFPPPSGAIAELEVSHQQNEELQSQLEQEHINHIMERERVAIAAAAATAVTAPGVGVGKNVEERGEGGGGGSDFSESKGIDGALVNVVLATTVFDDEDSVLAEEEEEEKRRAVEREEAVAQGNFNI